MGPLPKGEGLDARAWASARAAGALLGVVGTVAGAPPENPSDGGGEPRRVWGGVALRPHPGCPTGTLRVHPSTPTPAAQISLPPKEFKRFFSYTSNRHNHVWNRDTFFPPPRGWPGRAPRLARGARPAHTGGCWGAPRPPRGRLGRTLRTLGAGWGAPHPPRGAVGARPGHPEGGWGAPCAPSGPDGAHPIHPSERLGRTPSTPGAVGAHPAHPRGRMGRTPATPRSGWGAPSRPLAAWGAPCPPQGRSGAPPPPTQPTGATLSHMWGGGARDARVHRRDAQPAGATLRDAPLSVPGGEGRVGHRRTTQPTEATLSDVWGEGPLPGHPTGSSDAHICTWALAGEPWFRLQPQRVLV